MRKLMLVMESHFILEKGRQVDYHALSQSKEFWKFKVCKIDSPPRP
jgi:hypothetical protein